MNDSLKGSIDDSFIKHRYVHLPPPAGVAVNRGLNFNSKEWLNKFKDSDEAQLVPLDSEKNVK